MVIFPRENWDMLSHVLIFHGRRVCFARKPSCPTCTVSDACPSAFKAENVGRKALRSRPRRPAKKAAPRTKVKPKAAPRSNQRAQGRDKR